MDYRNKRYQDFFTAFKRVHQNLDPPLQQLKANERWKELKQCSDNNEKAFDDAVTSEIEGYKKKETKLKTSILGFFAKATSKIKETEENKKKNMDSGEGTSTQPYAEKPGGSMVENDEDEESVDDPSRKMGETHTPAQHKSQERLNVLKSRLSSLLLAQRSNFAPDDCDKQIKTVKKDIEEEEKKLKRKMKDASRKRKQRAQFKAQLGNICSDNPEIAKRLKLRDKTGRPSLEVDQPGLLETIERIATFGGGADSRRRSEIIRSCKTLDDLTEKLKDENFHISRSATYLRLIPKRSNAGDAKRHVNTVPVKLVKAEADEHKRHQDTAFAVASIGQVESLTSLMGPKQVFFLSQDDKARVPLGVTAANKQSQMLMHVEYRVRLPDHDFVVAEKHKLIPSVYAAMVIEPQGMGARSSITYSGPTYVAIRSGKHSSSTASTHSDDLKTLYELDAFKDVAQMDDGSPKPVLVISVDGGPDESPRSQKVLHFAVQTFERLNLDALFIITNAPGGSAYNRVERRMAPLSRELSGLLLPCDYYGSHLDSSRRTTDAELELANFGAAGEVLGEIWSNTTIDGHPVVAKYIPPGESKLPEISADANWLAVHVRQSQYFLQVVKCPEVACCGEARSNLHSILPDRFLPPPMKIFQNDQGFLQLSADPLSDAKFLPLITRLALPQLKPPSFAKDFRKIPYDLFCQSIQDQLEGRICSGCGLYHVTKMSAQEHRKASRHSNSAAKEQPAARVRPIQLIARREEVLCVHGDNLCDWFEDDDIDVEGMDKPVDVEEDQIPLAEPIDDWLVCPWTES